MKAFSYQIFGQGVRSFSKEIALFRHVEVSPNTKPFLGSKLILQNFCFMSIQSGQFDWKFNNKLHRLTPDHFVLACPGVEMEKDFRPIEIGSFYKISLKPDYYLEESTDSAQYIDPEQDEMSFIFNQFSQKGIVFLKNTDEVKRVFLKIEEEIKNEEVGHRVRIGALINEMIVSTYRSLVSEENTASDEDPRFDELTQSLKENLSHNWTVKEMARLSRMGITQLSNRMKARLGYSPFDYLIYLRLSKAISLLKETEEPITGIALDTGFYSSQHFSNTFKKMMGHSPRSFRKIIRNAAQQFH